MIAFNLLKIHGAHFIQTWVAVRRDINFVFKWIDNVSLNDRVQMNRQRLFNDRVQIIDNVSFNDRVQMNRQRLF